MSGVDEDTLLHLLEIHDAAEGDDVITEGPRGRRVTRLQPPTGWPVACKEEPCRTWRDRISRWLRGSRARRSQTAARALRAAGLAVPEPLGALELPDRSLWFARWIEGPTLAAALEKAGRNRAGELLVLAARYAARLHAAGFSPRDLKPANLIVGPGDELVLVDLDDVVAAHPTRALALRNLAALDAYAQLVTHPPGARPRVRAVREYAAIRGLDEDPLMIEALATSRAKRRRLRGGTA